MTDMNKMLKQMQKLQQKMEKVQEELAQKEVSWTSGGEMVTATVNGRQELVDLKINPEVIDPDDPEMLEDMVIAAVNGAMSEATAMIQQEMAKIAGGLSGIPGLNGLM